MWSIHWISNLVNDFHSCMGFGQYCVICVECEWSLSLLCVQLSDVSTRSSSTLLYLVARIKLYAKKTGQGNFGSDSSLPVSRSYWFICSFVFTRDIWTSIKDESGWKLCRYDVCLSRMRVDESSTVMTSVYQGCLSIKDESGWKLYRYDVCLSRMRVDESSTVMTSVYQGWEWMKALPLWTEEC